MTLAKKPKRIALGIGLFIIVLVFLIAQHFISPSSFKRPSMLALSPRLATIFAHTKTVCFGNFLIDVPATATVVYGPTSANSEIWYHAGEAHKLDALIAERLKEVEKERRYLWKEDEIASKDSLFGKVIDGAVPGQKLVFGSKDGVTYYIDSFIPIGRDLFTQWTKGARSLQEVQQLIDILNDNAKHLRPRAEDEIPTENGLCVEGGFVNFQPDYQGAAVGIRLAEIPDVHFSIDTTKNQDSVADADDLDQRLARAKNDGGLQYLLIKIFRHGARQIGEWSGTEILARKPALEKSSEAHEFLFFSPGEKNDPLRPYWDIRLDTGVKGNRTAGIKPGVSDEEAIALWDKLMSSIRLRPTNSPQASTAIPPTTPLGALLSTGNICPQTGWWQCNEGGEVAGGKRQLLKQGEAAPHAFILGEPSMLQKLQGKRPSYKAVTVWTLVEYATPTDRR